MFKKHNDSRVIKGIAADFISKLTIKKNNDADFVALSSEKLLTFLLITTLLSKWAKY